MSARGSQKFEGSAPAFKVVLRVLTMQIFRKCKFEFLLNSCTIPVVPPAALDASPPPLLPLLLRALGVFAQHLHVVLLDVQTLDQEVDESAHLRRLHLSALE
jgi:hypothetical protein